MSHRVIFEVDMCGQTLELGVRVPEPGAPEQAGLVERIGQGPSPSSQERWEVLPVAADEYLVRRPGEATQHRVWVRLDGPTPQVCHGGRSESVRVISARDKALARAQGGSGASAGGSISSPMPGRVVSILVEPGQNVQAGQGVLIVEAMKMENELVSSVTGVVERILVEVDQAVDAGQTLCEIETP